jgi:tRNA nucleotidyltransferase/poly(A) polymerase
MTAGREGSARALPSLADADWLAKPSVKAVFAALASAGYDARIVGGAIRNTLLGLPVSDLDMATPAPPDAVVAACKQAGLATIPTGIGHGTVTVIADRTPVEVTTLRRDVETDGRRATIAFTDDWAEDARRRDFTINALYCDAAGRLFDDVGGYPDLMARRVRFIGDADARIAEDYLRILRFFRFHAAYASGPPDATAMAAAARGLGGMARLSAERVRAELVRLLVAPRAVAAVEAMADIGLLPRLLGAAPRPGVLRGLVAAEARMGEAPDAMLRLSALAVAVSDDCGRLADRLRLSNDERRGLTVMERHALERIDARHALERIDACHALERIGAVDAHRARVLVYRHGAVTCRRLAVALSAIAPERDGEAVRLRDTAVSWTPPRMPLSGADLIARGVAPGPALGALLGRLEDWWVDHDFPPAGPLEAQLAVMLGRSPPG